jgi:Trk K+ transport system NAD-binding subunit
VRQLRTRLLGQNGASAPSGPSRERYVVCGDDPLTQRLVTELAGRYKLNVTVILPSKRVNHGPQIASIPGIRVVESTRLDEAAFRAAGVETATALALVHQDDVGNLQAALQAQELNPDLRLVVRMFNMSLGHTIRRLLRHCRVLSDASIAAPAFVASALGEVAPSYVRLYGSTLYAARREDVAAGDVLCGVADTVTSIDPVLLPLDEERCDLILTKAASGFGGPAPELEKASRRARVAQRWAALAPTRLFGLRLGRTLRIVAVVLLVTLVVGTVMLAVVDPNLSLWQAAYVTLLNTVGGANPDLDLSGVEQAIDVVLAVAGVAMVPVVTATVVEAVVNARLAFALGRLRGPVSGHVVVVGLGNVGTRVIQQLRDLGIRVVAIDRQGTARGAQLARDLGVPMVIGDASREETLREASVHTARALVVVSTDDVVNLEAGLHARTINPDIRVVLRLFDGEFADRVQRAFFISTSKSVSYLAAPAFTTAMLERDVIGTIPVRRRVLVVAEVPVEPGSRLAGAPAGAVRSAGAVRLIAVAEPGATYLARWRPPDDHRLVPEARLIVVATYEGLRTLLSQAASADVDPELSGLG